MPNSRVLSTALALILVLAGVGKAQATTIGAAYFVSELQSQNAVIGFAHGAPVATFSTPNGPIDFSSFACATCYLLGDFLLSNPGTIILTGTAADLASPIDVGGANPHGLMLEITGQVSVVNGQTFTVTHDDGLQLMIGGLLVVNTPGPTPPVTTTVTYLGPTGTFAFDLVYGECCGAPARLQTSLPLTATAVPEPATLSLVGLGVAGWGASRPMRRSS